MSLGIGCYLTLANQPWIKIKLQKLITLFINQHDNHVEIKVNENDVFCYCELKGSNNVPKPSKFLNTRHSYMRNAI